jgi:type II secretory pathway predicted ATPase ExeA
MNYWKLASNPFGADSPFVATPEHGEAVARLVHTIDAGQRLAMIQGASGLGKSRVLAEALREARSPGRRIALVTSPADGPSMAVELARGLGARPAAAAGRAAAWTTLVNAMRVCRAQRLQVVLAVDSCQDLTDPRDRLDLARLTHCDPAPSTRLSVLLATSAADGDDDPIGSGALPIRLAPLTRGDVAAYLTAKLAAAGRDDEAFTPRAVSRIHLLSAGTPRLLDLLAPLAMMAAALRRLEMVTPELVDGAAAEFLPASLAS